MKKMIAVAAMVIAMATAAQAQEPGSSLYFCAAPAVSGTRADVVVKPGTAIGVGLEDQFMIPGLTGTNEVGYYTADYQRVGGTPVDGGIWSVSALQSLKYTLPVGPVSPFVSAGLGLAYVHQDGLTKAAGGKSWNTWDLAFAYQASTGFAFQLGNSAQVDVSYRYNGTSPVDNGAVGVHTVGVAVHIPVGN